MKDFKIRPQLAGYDLDTKLKHIRKELSDGHDVKVVIMLRGREREHPELGQRIFHKVLEDANGLAEVQSKDIAVQNGLMEMVLNSTHAQTS